MRSIGQSGAMSSPGQGPDWESLEGFIRLEAQHFIQRVLEEEVEEFLGRKKSERRSSGGGVGA
jgi:hypothetical protein